MEHLLNQFAVPVAFSVCVLLYWAIPRHVRDITLAIAFCAILLALEPIAAAIMISLSVFTYLSARHLSHSRYVGLTILITVISSYLFITKYLPSIISAFGGNAGFIAIVIPLGLSYLTFRLIHYMIEFRAGRLPAHNFAEFLLYAAFIPIFTAGPIERFEHFIGCRKHTIGLDDVVSASWRIISGAIKAFAIPYLMIGIAPTTSIADISLHLYERTNERRIWEIWGALYFVALYFYLNIAGYADIAIGSSRLLGFKISENFNSPFMSTSIVEFWMRWHITLGDWCRTYIFLPVSRKLRSAVAGAIATFIVIGIWHQPNLSWLLWGLYHGLGIITVHAFRKRGYTLGKPKILSAGIGWLLTTAFVSIGVTLTLGADTYGVQGAFNVAVAAFGL